MRKYLLPVAFVALCLVVIATFALSTHTRVNAASQDDVVTLHVTEIANNVTPVYRNDMSAQVGDVTTFKDPLKDDNGATIGYTDGYCTYTDASLKYQECEWTNVLPGGNISSEGEFISGKDYTLATTGGTGKYRGVRGALLVHEVSAATSTKPAIYSLTFRIAY